MEIENHLREKRQALALSQKQLADMAGITRQAVSALEANQYSPATSVALQLARALHCRVEDCSASNKAGKLSKENCSARFHRAAARRALK